MGIMASSPATVRQFHPSDANSMAFLAAMVCSSCLSDQRRLRTRSEYSERMGIGTTETCSSNATSECSGTADASYLRGTQKGWIGGRGATPLGSTSSSTTPKRRSRRDRISRPLAVDGLLRSDVCEVASILDWAGSLYASSCCSIRLCEIDWNVTGSSTKMTSRAACKGCRSYCYFPNFLRKSQDAGLAMTPFSRAQSQRNCPLRSKIPK